MSKLGDWIKSRRLARGWSQADLAEAAKTTVNTVSRSELGKTLPKIGKLRAISEALGVEFSVVQALLNGEPVPQGDDLLSNVDASTMTPLHAEIPLFEASLAAGPWVDVSEVGEVCDPRQMDQGLFRVRIAGDSMTPPYQSGQVIEFRCLRPDREGPVVGKDYYFQKEDGTATFKRIKELREEEFVLAAMNLKKYPKAMVVPRALVVRIAVAVAVVTIL